jgi:hypothetical protein
MEQAADTRRDNRADDKIKVLLIAGAGRSGSTILDSILGQIDGFFSLGELRFVWERGLIANRLCGCGLPFRECPFWTATLAEAFGHVGGVDARRMIELQGLGTRARHLPLLFTERGRERLRERLAEYIEAVDAIIRSVHARTGSKVIVDSSKLPTYGFVLGMAPSVDLYVTHLVRDPRATAYSWTRKKALPDWGDARVMQQQRPFKSTLLWLTWNTVAGMLWARSPNRYMRLHYEDFADDPRQSVDRILRLVDEPRAHLPFTSRRTVQVEPTHNVAGNPSRFETGEIRVRTDDEWETRMPRGHIALVSLLSWPLLKKYRYPVRVPGRETRAGAPSEAGSEH